MGQYEVWVDGVGEVMFGSFAAESHKEVRALVYRQIKIRKVKEE